MSASITSASRRVLLFDDDEIIAGSLSEYLMLNGCAVDVAVEPLAAESMMRAQKYDVVVLDPYMTGGVHHDHNELIESVCRLQPAADVIVLTGYGSPALTRAAADKNISKVLSKPQSVVYLGQLITGNQ